MSVFDHAAFDQHEQVSFFHDPETGLKAIVAVHNTALGPALGGCRMWAYETDEQALRDVLRLARGMTYKAAITGLPLGGGKSVIIGNARKDKTPALMRAMGRAVESMGGKYLVAEDVGMTVADMDEMHKETNHVLGISGASGDPSPLTALGVFSGLQAAVQHRLGRADLDGLKVAVQGLGNVGYNLCRHLAGAGAQLFVTDVQANKIDQAVAELGATPVALDDIYGLDVDVFSPCALGAVINDQTIGVIKAKVVAGAANNQLATPQHGDALRARDILYAPDYVINAGGLVNVYYEYDTRQRGVAYDRAAVEARITSIRATTEEVFVTAAREGISTAQAADRMAEARFMGKTHSPSHQAVG